MTEASAARLGHLTDDLEVWLCPGDAEGASFTLFDGTVLRDQPRTDSPGARHITWRIFG